MDDADSEGGYGWHIDLRKNAPIECPIRTVLAERRKFIPKPLILVFVNDNQQRTLLKLKYYDNHSFL